MTQPPPFIEADALHVALDGQAILKGLTFRVSRGAWVGLLGPNGSGKTTLMRTLAGLLPYAGRLTLAGRPVRSWSPRALARTLAFVRQSLPFSFAFTVEEIVLLGRAPHKGLLSPITSTDRRKAREALARVDLAGFEDRIIHHLSGGEQQRVLLAQALAQEADLLLLDEPTAHLDVHHQYEFTEHVRTLVDAGRTVVSAFHDLELAARYADHLLVLDHGRLAAQGAPEAVLTPELLASVFRMRAELIALPGAPLRIHYQAPVPGPGSPATPPEPAAP